ncbi:unnamed protein product [Bursaphelenchus okinawaensis]|uniref:Uncharacterized protein n=1 Tax=Bursaphelenchus okinawaensis TaxID=465554 RepID=A0A811LK68_9BILA|nr:unnamed protein product [Bursaphelenchus okinawaensis]CAG9124040.1 unnamed protein product [Bursaphelenchus okinawaensis]
MKKQLDGSRIVCLDEPKVGPSDGADLKRRGGGNAEGGPGAPSRVKDNEKVEKTKSSFGTVSTHSAKLRKRRFNPEEDPKNLCCYNHKIHQKVCNTTTVGFGLAGNKNKNLNMVFGNVCNNIINLNNCQHVSHDLRLEHFLKQYGIVRREIPIKASKRSQPQLIRYQIKYKRACQTIYSALPPRKQQTAKQKREGKRLWHLLNIPDDEYLTAYQFYVVCGYTFYRERFNPLKSVDFHCH